MDQFRQEHDVPAMDIAAALAKMVQGNTPMLMPEKAFEQESSQSKSARKKGAFKKPAKTGKPHRKKEFEKKKKKSFSGNRKKNPA
jgi:ATP-dependent RNA helicase DeaD